MAGTSGKSAKVATAFSILAGRLLHVLFKRPSSGIYIHGSY